MYCLGVHQKAPILALEGDMWWITSDVRRQTEMLQLWNRLDVFNNKRSCNIELTQMNNINVVNDEFI